LGNLLLHKDEKSQWINKEDTKNLPHGNLQILPSFAFCLVFIMQFFSNEMVSFQQGILKSWETQKATIYSNLFPHLV
jgi:hypothetical protein